MNHCSTDVHVTWEYLKGIVKLCKIVHRSLIGLNHSLEPILIDLFMDESKTHKKQLSHCGLKVDVCP